MGAVLFMLQVTQNYLIEVLVEAIHEEQQQLLGVLLVIASKLLINLSYSDLEVPWANALVQTTPQSFHDHTKLLRHFPFMAKDVKPGRGREQMLRIFLIFNSLW